MQTSVVAAIPMPRAAGPYGQARATVATDPTPTGIQLIVRPRARSRVPCSSQTDTATAAPITIRNVIR